MMNKGKKVGSLLRIVLMFTSLSLGHEYKGILPFHSAHLIVAKSNRVYTVRKVIKIDYFWDSVWVGGEVPTCLKKGLNVVCNLPPPPPLHSSPINPILQIHAILFRAVRYFFYALSRFHLVKSLSARWRIISASAHLYGITVVVFNK